ncbi:MAG: hypothetical protein HMLIMOIP_002461 [Candidatus Nitrosomirales archaeon]|jgi:hypothetical protein
MAMLGLVTSIFTFSTPAQPVSAQNPSFGPVINLSNNTTISKDSQVAVSGTNVYVVWADDNNILLSRSTDSGATFSTPVNLSNDVTGFLPQIVASGTNVYVVWVTGDIFFSRSIDSGATFSAPVNLSNTGSTDLPQIAVSGTNVYVVWLEAISGTFDVFFSRSTDSGATFSTPVNLSNTVDLSTDQQLAVSGNNVYVVWTEDLSGNDVFFSRSTDSGATFSTPVKLSNNTGFSKPPQIVASGNNVYVVWQNDPATSTGKQEILFSRSTDSGATFSTPVKLSNNTGDSEFPQIAVSGSKVHVVWHDTVPGEGSEIFFSRSTDSGATFSTPVNLSNDADSSVVPQIVASGTNVYVVWINVYVTNTFDVFFSRSTDSGATFSAPLNLSNGAGSSNLSLGDMATSGNNVYVVWFGIVSGNDDVFFSASVEDKDVDGIFDNVDTLPTTFSNDFSDVGLSGTTTGTITTRGDQILTVREEPSPAGVRAKADPSGGPLPAVISACGGIGLFTLTPDDELVITCGSVTAQVISGTIEITFVASDGTQANVSLNQGNAMTFEATTSSFTAPSTNSETVVVTIEGEQFSIAPGQTITITLTSFSFSINIEPSSRTVAQGQSTSYDVTVNLVSGTTQPVSLSISGLPSGTTATFTPSSVTPNGTSTLFVSTTAPSGTHILNITATGGGVTKSATVDLVVAPITKESFMTDSQFGQINSFDTIFTADQSTSSLKLAATNPGTYFYNKIIRNTGTSTITVTFTLNMTASLSLPGPSTTQAFCLKGSNPVHVYGDQGRTIELTSLASISPSQPIANTNSQSFTCVPNVSIEFTILAGELRYITAHLDFNGKGSTGFTNDAATSYNQGFKFKETIAIGGIPGTIQDARSFTAVGKRATAIGGFAIDTDLVAKSALRVNVTSGSTVIGTSPVTFPDGFYFVEVPAGGPYTVQLFNPTTSSVVQTTTASVANDQYVQVDFFNLNPADPYIEGFVFDSAQGVADVTVNLYRVTGSVSQLMTSTTTSAGGWYGFRFTQPGTYTVEIVVPPSYTADNTSIILTIKQFETLRANFSLTQG